MVANSYPPNIQKPLVVLSTSSQLGGAEISLLKNLLLLSEKLQCVLVCKPELESLLREKYKNDLPNALRIFPSLHNLNSDRQINRLAINRLRKIVEQVLNARELRTIVKKFEPASIYVNDTPGILTSKLARLPNARGQSLVHARDDYSLRSVGRLRRLILKWSMNGVTHVIANSSYTLAGVASLVSDRTAIRVIPSIVDEPDAKIFDGTVVPSAKGPSTIGMISRISAQKGQMALLRAFLKIHSQYDARLILIGSPLFGEESEHTKIINFISNNGLSEKVELRSQIDSSQVYQEIAKLDICVHPTTEPEPLGQIVIQYLKMGRATLVSNEGGYLDWVKDGSNAVLCRANDTEDLAVKLANLIEDKNLRKKIGEAAKATGYPSREQIGFDLLEAINEFQKSGKRH